MLKKLNKQRGERQIIEAKTYNYYYKTYTKTK